MPMRAELCGATHDDMSSIPEARGRRDDDECDRSVQGAALVGDLRRDAEQVEMDVRYAPAASYS